jgi:hypothetical protein
MFFCETGASYESAITVVKRDFFVYGTNEQNMGPCYLFQRHIVPVWPINEQSDWTSDERESYSSTCAPEL